MSSGAFFTGENLMPGVHLARTTDLVHVKFAQPHRALSSAVLNGGYCHASDFLNVRVAKHSATPLDDPALTLQRLSEQLHCPGLTVGMMTAASLASLRVLCETISGETLAVLVTTGMENARRAGDPAEHRALEVVPTNRGTINLAVVTSAQVADEALVEMVAVATEAKVAILHEMEIRSPVSGQLATGTGTDAIAIFAGHGGHRARFAGKHTLLGERLAVMVMQVIRSSVNYQQASAV
jgi:adenosylcobinamide hydrolase